MREYAILCCILGAVACHRTSGDGQRDSSAVHDTTTPAGTPAATVPSPTRESIASRPRRPADSAASTPDARTSPGTRSIRPPTDFKPETRTPPTNRLSPLADTVRGIVSVVGTEHERHVTIARPGGGKRVEITGPLARLIGHVAGADVWVTGTSAGTSLEASRFVVKTVDGMPALDGTLKTEGSALYLLTVDGARTRITAPPPPLLGHDGARVWITGDPSRGVASFGFIDPPG